MGSSSSSGGTSSWPLGSLRYTFKSLFFFSKSSLWIDRENTPIFDQNVIIDLLADLLLAHRDCFFDFDFVLKQAYIQIAGTRRVRDVVYLPYLPYLYATDSCFQGFGPSVPTYLGIYRTSAKIYPANKHMYPKYIY